MKKCKAIIFDLGAVILNINYQNTINEFTKLGVKNAATFYSKKVGGKNLEMSPHPFENSCFL